MIVTGALFADGAMYVHGKLTIVGGVWDTYTLPTDSATATGVLIALVQFEPEDPDELPLTVDVTGPDGETVLSGTITADTPRGKVLGSMIIPLEMEFGQLGRHAFLLSGTRGDPLSIPLLIQRTPK